MGRGVEVSRRGRALRRGTGSAALSGGTFAKASGRGAGRASRQQRVGGRSAARSYLRDGLREQHGRAESARVSVVASAITRRRTRTMENMVRIPRVRL